jgi:aspartyl aminopeptidase
MNGGPVIKMNAAQRYATSGPTAALFRRFCRQADVPCQQFVMRNDLACGSTIGPLTAAALGVPAVDIGVPQLAMHSIRETAGSRDGWYLLRALTAYLTAPDEAIRCPESIP